MMNTPIIVPITEPTPPANEVPPTTTPAIASSSIPLPVPGRIVEYVAAYAIPAKPANNPLIT